MNSNSYRFQGFTQISHSSKLCLFHPDYNRWFRDHTEISQQTSDFTLSSLFLLLDLLGRGLRLSIRRSEHLPITTSEDFHLALKQNSLATMVAHLL